MGWPDVPCFPDMAPDFGGLSPDVIAIGSVHALHFVIWKHAASLGFINDAILLCCYPQSNSLMELTATMQMKGNLMTYIYHIQYITITDVFERVERLIVAKICLKSYKTFTVYSFYSQLNMYPPPPPNWYCRQFCGSVGLCLKFSARWVSSHIFTLQPPGGISPTFCVSL